MLHDVAAHAGAFLQSEAVAGRFRGAVLLSLHGEVLLRSGYGLANEEWRLSNLPTTRFRIGSVTKTFTAAAILRLIEAAVLTLHDPISTWLNDLPPLWHSFTVHQLLTHTTGLRDHLAVPAKQTLNRTGARPHDLTALIAHQQLLFPPGTSRAYSNTGYILLGMLIEKISNRPYAQFLQEEILQPAQLNATAYDSQSQIVPERASGYSLLNGTLQNADFLDMSVPFSAGGLSSTIDDLLQFHKALHRGSLLQPDSYRRMITEYPETQRQDGFYGYGLFIGRKSGYSSLSHSGGVSGFMAVVEYYPDLNASLILLSNLLYPPALPPVLDRLSHLLLTAPARGR